MDILELFATHILALVAGVVAMRHNSLAPKAPRSRAPG